MEKPNARVVCAAQLTDDVVDDAFSDMARQAILLLAEVLYERALLLEAVLPRRRREAADIMVINFHSTLIVNFSCDYYIFVAISHFSPFSPLLPRSTSSTPM